MSESQLSRYRSTTEQNGYPSVPVTTIFPRDSDTITDPTQIVFVPGWGEGRGSLQGVAATLALEGRVVSIYDNPRIPRGVDPNVFKTGALRGVMQHLRAEEYPVDLVPHSQGLINAVDAANQTPEQVRAIAAVAPAALAGTLHGIELTRRAVQEAFIQPSRALRLGKVALHAAGHVLRNVPTAWSEICAIAQADVREGLKQAREDGISITLVLCEGDKIFRISDIEGRLMETFGDVPLNVHRLETSHIGLLEDPKIVRFVHAAMLKVSGPLPDAAWIH